MNLAYNKLKMYNFTRITKACWLLVGLVMGSLALNAQEVDTAKTYTDTTTVKVKLKTVTGERVTGTIIDGNTNKPLQGVNITVPDFSAAITDDKGNFSITVPDYKASIRVSFNGYQTKIVPVYKGKPVRTKIYIRSKRCVRACAHALANNTCHTFSTTCAA